jgi:hypothetical protein
MQNANNNGLEAIGAAAMFTEAAANDHRLHFEFCILHFESPSN